MRRTVKYPAIDGEATYFGDTKEEVDRNQLEQEIKFKEKYGVGFDAMKEILFDNTMQPFRGYVVSDFPYKDNEWGVYKFNGLKHSVAKRLFELSEKWGENVIIRTWADSEDHEHSDDMFDTDNITLYVYYREINEELRTDVVYDPIISHNWSDTDTYILDPNDIIELRKQEAESRILLDKLINMSNQFNELVYA